MKGMTESFWESEEVLGEVKKNSREKFVVTRVSNKGKFYRDIRIYYVAGEEYKPSSKGIVIPEDKMEELLPIITKPMT